MSAKKTGKGEDQEIIICRCEEVSLQQIEAAIEAGAASINGVKRRTHAGMGLCQGRTCRRLVSQILAQKLDKKLPEIERATQRTPVRPLALAALAGEKDE